MKFNEQIYQIRTQSKLTQTEMADQLHVSRQTISSWETGRNLPDLETVVIIAQHFGITLDDLILGDKTMQTKLIKDTSKTHRARLNFGAAVLFIIGVICFLAELVMPSWVDRTSMLHEPYFFLIPIGYLMIFAGIVMSFVSLISKVRNRK
ncbi:helix-turn-helix domain-containing protein [Paucilactobacillus suebicus]|uniref:HTH cro/C1-type domain-containing protein n=1 Tax=Paucilactobacillus suebicus DSM 5007 = KCTC 3549 TaxID=1423807 RepID=A0A0R1W5W4_9LACO|nr:helix-turn-helix domain-containing protein [Paucilactobacillus suebicus]KRM10787.1 hypothetical protein FD16_GL001088 [Paucilactobacillus suebicus DSM 5007 = KCTC 3549]